MLIFLDIRGMAEDPPYLLPLSTLQLVLNIRKIDLQPLLHQVSTLPTDSIWILLRTHQAYGVAPPLSPAW